MLQRLRRGGNFAWKNTDETLRLSTRGDVKPFQNRKKKGTQNPRFCPPHNIQGFVHTKWKILSPTQNPRFRSHKTPQNARFCPPHKIQGFVPHTSNVCLQKIQGFVPTHNIQGFIPTQHRRLCTLKIEGSVPHTTFNLCQQKSTSSPRNVGAIKKRPTLPTTVVHRGKFQQQQRK